MSRRRSAFRARFGALFGPAPDDVRQTLGALLIGLVGTLAAGLALASVHGRLEVLPGLLLLVPAAIALRGTIFGALGARLATSIHTGTFTLSPRPDTVVGQNLLAAAVLTLAGSVAVALLAKSVAGAVGLAGTIEIADLVMISVVGGLLSSVAVAVITVGLAAAAVRYDWDADNVMAPLVTASGDALTLPALVLATELLDHDLLVRSISVVGVVVAVLAVALSVRSSLPVLRRVVIESLPIVIGGGLLSLMGGLLLERRLDALLDRPGLLALVPLVLATAGALGGILSSRLTSKLHLGVVSPTPMPSRLVRDDFQLAFLVGLPTFLIGSLAAFAFSDALDLATPGAADMLAIGVISGLAATLLSTVVAYYAAVVSFRVGLDPDNYAIPLVTSSIDLLGSVSFVATVALLVTGGT